MTVARYPRGDIGNVLKILEGKTIRSVTLEDIDINHRMFQVYKIETDDNVARYLVARSTERYSYVLLREEIEELLVHDKTSCIASTREAVEEKARKLGINPLVWASESITVGYLLSITEFMERCTKFLSDHHGLTNSEISYDEDSGLCLGETCLSLPKSS